METILRKDSEWGLTDGEPCRVINFTPMASVENEKVLAPNRTEPYAAVILECKKIPNEIRGLICHKVDFRNLWAAFKERGIKQNEEVIIFYSKKHLKSFVKLFSVFMPRIVVWICAKGTFELMTNPNFRPDLQGKDRFLAMKPIAEFKSEVMK